MNNKFKPIWAVTQSGKKAHYILNQPSGIYIHEMYSVAACGREVAFGGIAHDENEKCKQCIKKLEHENG